MKSTSRSMHVPVKVHAGVAVVGAVLIVAGALNSARATTTSGPPHACVTVYQHVDFEGDWRQFCSLGGSSTAYNLPDSWDEKISSLNVPDGVKAVLCEDPDRGRFCRAYFSGSHRRVGSAMNDRYSFLEVGRFDADDFTMVIMSDAQHGRDCEEAAGGPCSSGASDIRVANEWHSESIEQLSRNVGFERFAGVIVNGDLTDTARGHQLEEYIELYEEKGLNLYPGLGNHDYDNRIRDTCHGFPLPRRFGDVMNLPARGYCVIRLLDFVVNRVDSIPKVSWDRSSRVYADESVTIPGFGPFPDVTVSATPVHSTDGSLAYSFDVGGLHLVQLNNHPAYQRRIRANVSSKFRIDQYDIKRSMEWLETDLARNAYKPTVVNLHVFEAERFGGTVTDQCDSECVGVFRTFRNLLLAHPQVVAVVAGHLHQTSGRTGAITSTATEREIPVYLAGSAEDNHYLKVRFQQHALEFERIDSVDGDVLSTTVFYPTGQPAVHVKAEPVGPNPVRTTGPSFSDGLSWDIDRHPRAVADVNGDGRRDVVAFGNDGVYVGLATTDGFAPVSRWLGANAFGYNNGWRIGKHPRRMVDVNGDGLSDVVGFGYGGVAVSLSDGQAFGTAQTWVTDFGARDGWDENNPRMMADVDGDGALDIVGFGANGVFVSRARNGGFEPAQRWLSGTFTEVNGWRVGRHPRLVADVDGDGRGDLVGFASRGVYVSLSTGTGFLPATRWQSWFGVLDGWGRDEVRTLADVNGDGKADVVGFGFDGVYVALAGVGGFHPPSRWVGAYGSRSGGWTTEKHPRLVRDFDGDGRADIVGFGADGTYLSLSRGDHFESPVLLTHYYGYRAGWRTDAHDRQVTDIDGDGDADIVGLGTESVFWSRSRDGAL